VVGPLAAALLAGAETAADLASSLLTTTEREIGLGLGSLWEGVLRLAGERLTPDWEMVHNWGVGGKSVWTLGMG